VPERSEILFMSVGARICYGLVVCSHIKWYVSGKYDGQFSSRNVSLQIHLRLWASKGMCSKRIRFISFNCDCRKMQYSLTYIYLIFGIHIYVCVCVCVRAWRMLGLNGHISIKLSRGCLHWKLLRGNWFCTTVFRIHNKCSCTFRYEMLPSPEKKVLKCIEDCCETCELNFVKSIKIWVTSVRKCC
jgi:hypothetical protein